MKKPLPAISDPACLAVSQSSESETRDDGGPALNDQTQVNQTLHFCARQSGKLHSLFAAYMAFGAAVFVSVVAAATVASNDMPLMLGGF